MPLRGKSHMVVSLKIYESCKDSTRTHRNIFVPTIYYEDTSTHKEKHTKRDKTHTQKHNGRIKTQTQTVKYLPISTHTHKYIYVYIYTNKEVYVYTPIKMYTYSCEAEMDDAVHNVLFDKNIIIHNRDSCPHVQETEQSPWPVLAQSCKD